MKATYFIPALTILAACSNTPDYDATGIFEATTVTLSAETSGRILWMDISEGDSVIAGENIAVVDTTILSLQQKQLASRQLATETTSPDIIAQASALRSQIAHWQGEVNRQQSLLADGATTQKNYDDAVAQLRTLRSQLDAQLSSLT